MLSAACTIVEKPEFFPNLEAAAEQLPALPFLAGRWSAFYDVLIVLGDKTTTEPRRAAERRLEISAARSLGLR